MENYQLKSIRVLANIFDADTQIPNRDAPPPPPLSLPIKKSSKLPRVEDQIEPPPRVDPDEESKDREQKLLSPTQATQPSAAIWGKYTKKLKELVKQRRRGHYTGNKYYLPQATHRYYTIVQGMRM